MRLARTSHGRAAHFANHLVASEFVIPRRIRTDMAQSSSPAGGQSITRTVPRVCEIFQAKRNVTIRGEAHWGLESNTFVT
jgi:hypothetical protein